jgi:hypothetical protein
MTGTLPMNRRRDEVPTVRVCRVPIVSHERYGHCICGEPVRWGYDGVRPILEHGRMKEPTNAIAIGVRESSGSAGAD